MLPNCKRCGACHEFNVTCDDGMPQTDSKAYPKWRKVRNWVIRKAWRCFRLDLSCIKKWNNKRCAYPVRIIIDYKKGDTTDE